MSKRESLANKPRPCTQIKVLNEKNADLIFVNGKVIATNQSKSNTPALKPTSHNKTQSCSTMMLPPSSPDPNSMNLDSANRLSLVKQSLLNSQKQAQPRQLKSPGPQYLSEKRRAEARIDGQAALIHTESSSVFALPKHLHQKRSSMQPTSVNLEPCMLSGRPRASENVIREELFDTTAEIFPATTKPGNDTVIEQGIRMLSDLESIMTP